MNPLRSRRRPADRTPRRGSVLVVVLALLAALMLLGFLFFTIASQERENARYFTASEKFYSAPLSPDELMDFALEQVIVGPQDDFANSALWGGRYSLLAGLVGDDLQPYSGRGVNVIDATQATTPPAGATPGRPAVDQDRNGDDDPIGVEIINDGVDDQLTLDLAEWARTYTTNVGGPVDLRAVFAKPDVGYSYPDFNSPFLAYIGKEPTTGETVVIPSFHRPQYLRGLMPAGSSGTWYTDPATMPYVMRPHAARNVRLFNYSTGEIVDTGYPRFANGAAGAYFTAPSPDPTKFGTATDPSEGFWDWAGPTGAPPEEKYDADPDGDGIAGAVWLDLDHPVEETPDGTTKFIPLYAITIYDLDGLLNLNAHGNLYGELNQSDVSVLPTGPVAGNPFYLLSRGNEGRRRYEVNPQVGLLSGAPGSTPVPANADTTQHGFYFGHVPVNEVELANMEWWFLLAGRGELDNAGTAEQLYPGRWGEADILEAALGAKTRNPYMYPRPGKMGSDEPAGVADGNRGLAFMDIAGQLFPQSMLFPAPRQPMDNHGRGTFVGLDGKTPLIDLLLAMAPTDAQAQAVKAVMGRVRVPLYKEYWLPPQTVGTGPIWAYLLGADFSATYRLVTAVAAPFAGLVSPDGRLVDDPGETRLDPEQARDQVTDSLFPPDETAYLHMSDADLSSNSVISRLLNLAPANFDTADDAADRRKRFTTISADLKAYSLTVDPARPWEVEAIDPQFPNAPTFPPRFFPINTTTGQFDPREPFRLEARGLLAALPNMASAPTAGTALKQLTRKLSANHIASAAVGQDGQPRFLLRPLTPHPVRHPANGQPVLPSTAVATPTGVVGNPLTDPRFAVSDLRLFQLEKADNDFADGYLPAYIPAIDHDADPATAMVPNPALQEWHARRDRQNLARDIYTLLYTFGYPDPAADVTTTNPYAPEQLIEMAQFAVNVVDAMDPDDTITCFVFDMDPTAAGGGYTPLDDGYVDPVPRVSIDFDPAVDANGDGDPANDTVTVYVDQTTNRGMVYGVEAQQLAFGEALAVFAKKFEKAGPGSGTVKDHKATDWDDSRHYDFALVELQNMTPGDVRFEGGWSIVCQATTVGGSGTPLVPRAVTLNDPGTPVAPGAAFTVGSTGDAHNTDRGVPSDPRTTWSTANQTQPRPSHFSVDLQGSESSDPGAFTDYEQIAPVRLPPDSNPLDFDLMAREGDPGRRHTFRVNNVDLTNLTRDQDAFGGVDADEQPSPAPSVPKAGGWLNLGTVTDRDTVTGGTVTFHLRRRLNLNRTTPAQVYGPVTYTAGTVPPDAAMEQDNPWVIVDTIEVPLEVFDLYAQPDLVTAVAGIESEHRIEPLANLDATSPDYDNTVTPYEDHNSLGVQSDDPATPGIDPMRLWHRHFDRAFASVADLLTVPLYGPEELTDRLGTMISGQWEADPRQTAAVRFLFPDDAAAQNLWYRLFEFVEVPHKYGDNDSLPWFAHYGGPSPWLSDTSRPESWLRERLRLREFGKLNLNTMRHPQALAGLLDDPRVFNLVDPDGAGPVSPNLPTANSETWLGGANPRNWWLAMLASRDGGFDPYTLNAFGQNVILPGVPSAEPFIDFGSAPAGATPQDITRDFQQTLLRSMPAGPMLADAEATAGRRSLFALGQVDTTPPLLGSDADFATRYRLLGKVLNHATTRSNTYVAFIQVDFFEATQPDPAAAPGVWQIGAKTADSPGYRGVFVIDRSLALEMLTRRDLPPTDPQLVYPLGSKYRTYSFARQRGPDGRPAPTFDWRDLILYRDIIEE